MGALKISFFVLFCGLTSGLSAQESQQESKKQFVEMMISKHQFDAKMLSDTLAQAEKSEKILASIAKPWEAKPWHQYYPIFLTEKRLNKGVEFWQKHKDVLQRAEQELGVPAEIIVAIIGVETYYGSYKGTYPVLDALYTLGFYYPPRAKFFRSELAVIFTGKRRKI